jgi:hypothetical protein
MKTKGKGRKEIGRRGAYALVDARLLLSDEAAEQQSWALDNRLTPRSRRARVTAGMS